MGRRMVMAGVMVCVAGVMGLGQAKPAVQSAGAAAAAKPLWMLTEQEGGVLQVGFSPDGKMVAGVGADGTARVWDAGTGKLLKTMKGHDGPVASMSWSPDGKQLATGGFDRWINVWDVGTGKLVDRHRQLCPVYGLTFLPDGKRLVSICGETVRWWQEGQDEELFDKPQGEGQLLELAGTPEGEVVVGDDGGHVVVLGKEGETVATNEVRSELPATARMAASKNWVNRIFPLGKSEALLIDNAAVWDWNWKDGTKKRAKSGGGRAVAITPDREMLAVSLPQMVEVIDLKNQRLVLKEEMKNPFVTALAISPAGDRLAVSSGGEWNENGWKTQGASVVWVYDLKAAAEVMGEQRKAAAGAAGGT